MYDRCPPASSNPQENGVVSLEGSEKVVAFQLLFKGGVEFVQAGVGREEVTSS